MFKLATKSCEKFDSLFVNIQCATACSMLLTGPIVAATKETRLISTQFVRTSSQYHSTNF